MSRVYLVRVVSETSPISFQHCVQDILNDIAIGNSTIEIHYSISPGSPPVYSALMIFSREARP